MTYTQMIMLFQSKMQEFGIEDESIEQRFINLRNKSDALELMKNPRNPNKSVDKMVDSLPIEKEYVDIWFELFIEAKTLFFKAIDTSANTESERTDTLVELSTCMAETMR